MIKKLTKNKAFMIILLTVFLLTLSTIGAVNATSKNTKDVKDTTLTKKEVKVNYIKKADSLTNKEIKKVNNYKKVNTTKTVKTNADTTSKTQTTNTETTSVKKNIKQKNLKTATQTVNDYDELSTLLTGSSETELIVDLDGDDTYTSTGQISVKSTIKKLTINGKDRTIDGDESYGFLKIGVMNLTLNNITVNNCHMDKDGPVIQCKSDYTNVTLNNSNFDNNVASVYTSASVVYQNSFSNININNCTFTNNKGDGNGGVISQYSSSTITINNSKFIGNEVTDEEACGGVIHQYNYYADRQTGYEPYTGFNVLFINNSLFEDNTGSEQGGAIYVSYNTTMTISNSNFTSNSASNWGGAIYERGFGNVKLDFCKFEDNSAQIGGAIYVNNNITLNYCNLTKNEADYGGALAIDDERYFPGEEDDPNLLIGYTTITNTYFTNNKATTGYGGAIYDYIDSGEDDPAGNHILIQDTEFNGNNATAGGAIYTYNLYNDFETTINHVNFTNNKADKSGALLTVHEGDVTITNSNFTSNYATNTSATIRILLDGLVNIEDNTFTSNWVGSEDGYVFTLTENTKINNNVFINNTDNTRDMLFDILAGEVKGNVYIDNYLEDSFNTTFNNVTVDSDYTKSVLLDLRDVYNDTIRNGTIQILVNGQQKYSYNVKDGKSDITIKFADLKDGKNEITVKYVTLSKHYQNMTKEFSITADKSMLNTKINVTATTPVKVGDDVTIKGVLVDENDNAISEATVTIKINNKEYNVTTDNNGKFTKTIVSSVVGTNNVTVSYAGSDSYNSSTNKTTFKVEKLGTKLSLDKISDSKVGDGINIKGKLVDENNKAIANQTVTINVNGKDYTVTTDNDGTYTKTLTADTSGKNNVSVSYNGNSNYTSSSNKTTFNVKKVDTKIKLNKISTVTVGDKAKVSGKLLDENNNAISNAKLNVTVGGKTYTVTTDENGAFTVNHITNTTGKINVKVKYPGSSKYTSSDASTTFNVVKQDVNLKVKDVTGTIGEKITFTATVTDKKGNKITGGNLIFKLNGVTFNDKKRFDNSSKTPYKFEVKNGKVTFTITADSYLEHGGNITATYSGTETYKNVTSKSAKLTVKLRNMKITVKAEPSRVKQYKNVTFTATLTDVTKNSKNKTAIKDNSYVLFILNGKTLKVKGKLANVTVKSNKVTYKYTIPAGTAGIYVDRHIRYYNVTAVYGSKLFYTDNNSASTNYTVARSKITITVNKAVLKSKKLSIKGSIKDYMKKYVKGTNKVCIKIDGSTYKINGKVKYFKIKNGRINLKNIKINNPSSVKTVSVVSGDRVAYLKGQSKAKKIVKV